MRGAGRADHGGAIKNQSRGSVFSRWASRRCPTPAPWRGFLCACRLGRSADTKPMRQYLV